MKITNNTMWSYLTGSNASVKVEETTEVKVEETTEVKVEETTEVKVEEPKANETLIVKVDDMIRPDLIHSDTMDEIIKSYLRMHPDKVESMYNIVKDIRNVGKPNIKITNIKFESKVTDEYVIKHRGTLSNNTCITQLVDKVKNRDVIFREEMIKIEAKIEEFIASVSSDNFTLIFMEGLKGYLEHYPHSNQSILFLMLKNGKFIEQHRVDGFDSDVQQILNKKVPALDHDKYEWTENKTIAKLMIMRIGNIDVEKQKCLDILDAHGIDFINRDELFDVRKFTMLFKFVTK